MVRTVQGIAREEVSATRVEYWGMIRTALGIAREEVSTTGVEYRRNGPHSAGHSHKFDN